MALKVLLVEDDELFRSTIKRSIMKKPCEVVEAPNGKVAKEIMLLHKFDLVISDIQMPHFNGIELLEWSKQNSPTPIVLMTGFSQILETQKAHDIGANDFLAKPFKEADLHEILEKYLVKGTSVRSVVEEDFDKDYCKVSVDEFLSDKESEFDIYIRISKSKYIKVAHQGGKLSDDRILAYKEKGVHYVYIRREDFPRVVKFNLKVAKAATQSTSLEVEKKINFMKHTAQLILENTFVNGVNVESFHDSKEFIATSMQTLTEDEQVMTILEILSSHADFLYAHSLGVSTFAVMIGKELGWTSAPTLFKLALGGLFHDIGKKEIAKEILEKPRALLSQKERSLVESHPTRGREILESLPSIPSEVVLIAYQHHEDVLGQGFPRGISKNEIHPLTKVVQVANIFCEYAIKCRPDIKPIPAKEAITNMENYKKEILDKDAFAALKRLFK